MICVILPSIEQSMIINDQQSVSNIYHIIQSVVTTHNSVITNAWLVGYNIMLRWMVPLHHLLAAHLTAADVILSSEPEFVHTPCRHEFLPDPTVRTLYSATP